jgi:hypothetical protein
MSSIASLMEVEQVKRKTVEDQPKSKVDPKEE